MVSVAAQHARMTSAGKQSQVTPRVWQRVNYLPNSSSQVLGGPDIAGYSHDLASSLIGKYHEAAMLGHACSVVPSSPADSSSRLTSVLPVPVPVHKYRTEQDHNANASPEFGLLCTDNPFLLSRQ